jgi:hypothetical protein
MAEQYGPQGPPGPPRPPEPREPSDPPERARVDSPGERARVDSPGAYSYEPYSPEPEPGSRPAGRLYSEAHPAPGPPTPPRGAERVKADPGVPRWLARLPYAFVLCGVAAGLAVVATNHFRRGSMLIAASVFIGALARLVLPESQVGLLAVRRKWLDVFLLTAAAVGITLVAFVAKGTSG